MTTRMSDEPLEVNMESAPHARFSYSAFAFPSSGLRTRRGRNQRRRQLGFQHGDFFKHIGHHVLHGLALDFRFRPDDQSMSQDAKRDRLDILVREIMPAIKQGAGPSAAENTQRSPRAGAQGHVRVLPASLGYVHDVMM